MKILYKTRAISRGGRRGGKVQVENSSLEFQMVAPLELGGSGEPGVNPEQLFAAGYAACFESAFRHAAKRKKIELKSLSVAVTVGIGPDEKGGYALSADITVIVSGMEQYTADELLQEAHQICPYSNATRGNIEVNLSTKLETEKR